MPAFISPYALLSASRPKSAPAVQSPYDLYSMAQDTTGNVQESTCHADELPQTLPPIPPSPQPRTHYISDIHARHSKASVRTAFKNDLIP